MHNPMIGRVTSHYDLNRKHPVFHTVQPHRGIDLGAPLGVKPWDYIGAPIHAAYSGVVECLESNWKSGWSAIWGRSGNGIFIRNPDGEGQWYGHLNRVYVKKGQRVTEGEIIGEMGVSGNVTGPHIHFETHNRGSGPANNYTRTRDPMIDFRAAGIIPGAVIQLQSNKTQATPATTMEDTLAKLDNEDLANIRKIVDEALDKPRGIDNRHTTAWWKVNGKQQHNTKTRYEQELRAILDAVAEKVGVSAEEISEIHAAVINENQEAN